MGAGVSTPIGAFALDTTLASTGLRESTVTGSSFRLRYSKLLSDMGTNFTLAAYRDSTSGFCSLQDAISAFDYQKRGPSAGAIDRQRSQLQLTISLDPEGMSAEMELGSTSQPVAPYAGAIAKLTFATRHTRADPQRAYGGRAGAAFRRPGAGRPGPGRRASVHRHPQPLSNRLPQALQGLDCCPITINPRRNCDVGTL